MKHLLAQVDPILRPPAGETPGGLGLFRLMSCTLFFGAFYGCIMGTFGGVAGERVWQLLISGMKVPLLLMATFALSLPSYFVLNNLHGVRSDFGQVLRALVSSQTGLTVVLAALAPYTLFWYASSADYRWALLFNGFMFAVASLAGHVLLQRQYRPLLAKNQQHRRLLRIWLVVYIFVGVQMAWILRPFVGSPDMPVQFFREESWGNAYVIVGAIIWETIKR
jgi:hypothetical protein